jgi:hypothetical protein
VFAEHSINRVKIQAGRENGPQLTLLFEFTLRKLHDSIDRQDEIFVNGFLIAAKSATLSAMGIEIVHLPRIQNHRASSDPSISSPEEPFTKN